MSEEPSTAFKRGAAPKGVPPLFKQWFEGATTFRLRTVIVLGSIQIALYGIICFLSPRFTFGSNPRERPILAVLILFGAAFGLYLLSLTLVWNFPGTKEPPQASSRLCAIIFGFAFVFRVVLWWSEPIQETDFYRYLWDGRVVAEGLNPYLFSPAQIERDAGKSQVLKQLTELKNRSLALQTIFSRIDQREIPTIYPPFSQAVFAAVALATPPAFSVVWQIRSLKFILLLFDMATGALLCAILRELAMPAGRTIGYAWCPLVLKEFADSAHLDSIAVCLLTLAVWLLIKASAMSARRRSTILDMLAAIAWALAILAKLFPIILAPVFIRVWWKRLRWTSMLLPAVSAVVLGLAYLPIVRRSPPAGVPDAIPAADSFSGLRTFASRWEMNDLLFMVARKNLGERESSWFTVTPLPFRVAIEERAQEMFQSFGIRIAEISASFLLTQLLMGALVLLICLWTAFRSWTGDARQKVLESVFLSLAWLWFLSPTQNPWYWTWTLPFVVFARSRVWLVVSGFAFFYYLRFWMEYQFPEKMIWDNPFTGAEFFDEVVVWLEHMPILLLLAFSAFSSHPPDKKSAIGRFG